ncbi:MAG: VanZ family protein [Thermoanaerobaculia bacterium]|nr:VanZ family protein [Thermoanaerobaculia bacterium]
MSDARFFPTGRERWLWSLAGLYVGLIYGSAYFVRFAAARLRDEGVLTPVVAGVGTAAVVGAVTWWSQQGIDPRELLLLVPAGALYLALWTHLERVEERIHLVEYGILGLLLHEALVLHRRGSPDRGWRHPALGAVILVAALGWLDEGIQHLLPNRYYDLRDVALNAVAGILAVGLVAARRRFLEAPPLP